MVFRKIRKHIVENTIIAEAGAVVRAIPLAIGTLNPDYFTNTNNVMAESTVGKITIQIDANVTPQAGITVDALDWYIWFNVNNGQPVQSPVGIGTTHTKNQVFHQDGALFTTPAGALYAADAHTATWRIEIGVPRSWSRLQDGDQIQLVYIWQNAPAVHQFKYRAIYTEVYA